jgi:hypothetical protein
MFANVSSLNLIANAYGVGMHQVIGFPEWAETDRYSLMATMDREKYEAFKTLPMDEQLRQQRLMTQAVLADRYQLKAHYETREMPVYELVVAHGGLKLTGEGCLNAATKGHLSFSLEIGTTITARWRTSPTSSRDPRAVSLSTRRDWGRRHSVYFLKWTSDSQSGTGRWRPFDFHGSRRTAWTEVGPRHRSGGGSRHRSHRETDSGIFQAGPYGIVALIRNKEASSTEQVVAR